MARKHRQGSDRRRATGAVLVPPFDAAEVVRALRGLRITPLVDGVRGEPPLDVEAVAALLIGVGRLARAARAESLRST